MSSFGFKTADWQAEYLFYLVQTERLNLQPEYQREHVWNEEWEGDLIVTMLKRMAIPPLIVHQLPSGDYDMVDGQQRTTAIAKFLKRGLRLPRPKDEILIDGIDVRGMAINDLPPETVNHFRSYPVYAIIIENANEKEIREQFTRVQKAKTLTQQQKRDALKSALGSKVKEMITHPYFSIFGSSPSKSREILARFLLVISKGEICESKDEELRAFYMSYPSTDDLEQESIKSSIRHAHKVLDLVAEAFPEHKKLPPPLRRVTTQFTLLLVVSHAIRYCKLPASYPERLAAWFYSFMNDRVLITDAQGKDLVAVRWSNASGSRSFDQARFNYMWEHHMGHFADLVPKDRRRFSEVERASLYARSNGKCEQCGKAISSEFHADHYIPHSLGGQTTIDNGQALCAACNLKKSDSIDAIREES